MPRSLWPSGWAQCSGLCCPFFSLVHEFFFLFFFWSMEQELKCYKMFIALINVYGFLTVCGLEVLS